MKLNMKRVMQAAKQSMFGDGGYSGFCTECGYEQDGCEPDAREYICERCKMPKVYGAEELVMMFG